MSEWKVIIVSAQSITILIIAGIGTHDDESDRVVMEVLKDVINNDLE